jgi:hypothetical protein
VALQEELLKVGIRLKLKRSIAHDVSIRLTKISEASYPFEMNIISGLYQVMRIDRKTQDRSKRHTKYKATSIMVVPRAHPG